MAMIQPINITFRPRINDIIAREWGGPMIVTRGVLHDTTDAEGFIFLLDGELAGYVLYQVEGRRCEVLVLQSIKENRGAGSALLKAVIDMARQNGCTLVWLITTNDNMHAIRFYQRFGFELAAVHINALEEARRKKPSIPLIGEEGIPIKHEFEFQYRL